MSLSLSLLRFSHLVGLLSVLLTNDCGMAAAIPGYGPSTIVPPAVSREFRGVWVASVKNLDWPPRPGLSTSQQQAELIALLDQASELRLNAVLFQIRPACDALYASTIEPWSEYLTGQMGRAPSPYYDPLAFAVREAHRRGLELHAWFNPYRARHHQALSPITPQHISRTRPDLVRPYGQSLWLDPGEREVQEYSLRVVMDVVRRYDIDGVHFDDYFYPYPEKDPRGQVLPFPDNSSWKRYQDGGGRLGREDWRRENVNLFMMRVSQSIHGIKPWIKFGIAPFGIWRPGFPAQIKGLDAFGVLYADARKWLREGWVDYLVPQLYWGEEKRETSFRVLAEWWAGENVRHRHVWPGLDLTRVGEGRAPEEIVHQVKLSRGQVGTDGNVHWGVHAITENRRGLRELMAKELYARAALSPAYPWLDREAPSAPEVKFEPSGADELKLRVSCAAEQAWLWVVQRKSGADWTTEIIPGMSAATLLTLHGRPDMFAISAVDRCSNSSRPVVFEKTPTQDARSTP